MLQQRTFYTIEYAICFSDKRTDNTNYQVAAGEQDILSEGAVRRRIISDITARGLTQYVIDAEFADLIDLAYAVFPETATIQ